MSMNVSSRIVRFGNKVGQIVPNGTNLGLFKISLSTFWLGEKSSVSQNALKLILKSPRLVPFGLGD